MAHNEGPDGIYRADYLQLTTTDTDAAATTEGRIKLSGGKIWFDLGTSWEIVTSSAP